MTHIHPATDTDDGTLPLFELADNAANGNHQRGHIALIAEGETATGAYFIDLGPTLKFSAQHSGEMTPETVRALGVELIAWADHKDPAGAAEQHLVDGIRRAVGRIDIHSSHALHQLLDDLGDLIGAPA